MGAAISYLQVEVLTYDALLFACCCVYMWVRVCMVIAAGNAGLASAYVGKKYESSRFCCANENLLNYF